MSMLDIVSNVKGLVVQSASKKKIDDLIFRFHYKLTASTLFVCSVLVTSKQYLGDPIDCMVDEIPPGVMDSFCWIYSTFTLPDKLKGRIGTDLIQPGVASHIHGEDEVKYHKYYQWVGFALCFQGLLFYIPHYLWKSWEAKRIEKLTHGLNNFYNKDEKDHAKNIQSIADIMNAYRKTHSQYAYRYMICEFLNVVNVIGQIFLIDYFLDGEFSSYGWDVFFLSNVNPDQRTDPMARVFPKMTKCTFNKYGPSGTIQKFDGLCILPVNILNEKIYAIMWLWLVILAIVTIGYFIYNSVAYTAKSHRLRILKNSFSLADTNDLNVVVNGCNFGDWFVLQLIGKNIDPSFHKPIMEKLANS